MFSPTVWLLRRSAPQEENAVWLLWERFAAQSRYFRLDALVVSTLLLGGGFGSLMLHPLFGLVAAFLLGTYYTTATHFFTLRLFRTGWIEDILLSPLGNRDYWIVFLRIFCALAPVSILVPQGLFALGMFRMGVPPLQVGLMTAISTLYLAVYTWGNYWSCYISYSGASVGSGFIVLIIMFYGLWKLGSVGPALYYMDPSFSPAVLVPALAFLAAGFLPMEAVRTRYTVYLLTRYSKKR